MKRIIQSSRWVALATFFGLYVGICHGGEDRSSLFSSRLTLSEAQLVELGETHADKYGLSPAEMTRYFKLMQGYLGFWNPSMDPILALGLFAENPEDERRYAELYAEQEAEMTERTLRFQRAYRAAFDHLYPNAPLIDRRLLAPYIQHREKRDRRAATASIVSPSIAAGDRLRWFVSLSCEDCLAPLAALVQRTARLDDVRIDIFLVDAASDDAVRAWAKQAGIAPAWVRSNRVTLNRDAGTLQALREQSGMPLTSLPLLLLQRDKQFFQLRMETTF